MSDHVMNIGARVQILRGKHAGRIGRVTNQRGTRPGDRGVKLDRVTDRSDEAIQYTTCQASDLREIGKA